MGYKYIRFLFYGTLCTYEYRISLLTT